MALDSNAMTDQDGSLLPHFHSFHVKWVKCAKDFRKIEGQQIRQVVSLTERCIMEG